MHRDYQHLHDFVLLQVKFLFVQSSKLLIHSLPWPILNWAIVYSLGKGFFAVSSINCCSLRSIWSSGFAHDINLKLNQTRQAFGDWLKVKLLPQLCEM